MKNNVFNSTFELSLRILLTLSITDNTGRTLDNIVTADFITIYAKEFNISDSNLHGNNDFSYTEYAVRRLKAQDAIKSLVLEDMVIISEQNDGFHYSISERGRNFCDTLTSEYAVEYKNFAKKTKQYMKTKSEKDLLNLISQEATKSLRRR